MSTRAPFPAAGFTLIEVLLAMAIAGLLFTGAFWGLQQAISARNDLSNQATPYIIGPAILDVIAADLANAYFYDFKENNCFYGTKAELLGKEADALSFITLSPSYAPEKYGAENRDSYTNEVGYVLRTGQPGTPFLELWRREDFFVDDRPHADGDFVLLYDKVQSMTVKYVSRNPETTSEGVGGKSQKSEEDMLQDGWNSVKERGVPRAVQITLSIFAREGEQAVDVATAEGEAKVYTFQRYLALPQVAMSLSSEQQIASWDGKYSEGVRNKTANKGGPAGQPGQPGQPGTPGQPPPRGGAHRPPRGPGPAAGQNPGSVPAGSNPFLQALKNRGGGRPPAGGGAVNLGALFGGRR